MAHVAAVIASVLAYNNGRGRVPPMGWNSWCTGQGSLEPSACNLMGRDPCSDKMVRSVADAIVEQGMDKLGYQYVCLDDCWSSTSRNATGHLQVEANKFPHGLADLADYVHSRGLLFGVYTSVGTETCKGNRPGSYGHYEQDADTLASWGIDFIKMDHCGLSNLNNTKNNSDYELYGEMSRALNATGRPILFSLCQWGESQVWEWGAQLSQMFRIQQDHLPFYDFPATGSGVGYGQGTLNIINWMGSLQPSKWTKQYGWLDPDFLMTLFAPTMDFVASRTEMTFWTLWSSPLLVSTDVRELTDEKKSILMNPEVIAINQDLSHTAGDRIRNETGGGQLWARDLANGDKAVVLFNSGLIFNATVSVSWSEIGWPSDPSAALSVKVRDLWARQDVGVLENGYSSTLAPRDVKYLRLTRQNTTD